MVICPYSSSNIRYAAATGWGLRSRLYKPQALTVLFFSARPVSQSIWSIKLYHVKPKTGTPSAGGEGKPVYLQVQLGYGADEERLADEVFHQWRTNIFPGKVKGDLWKVEHFDALAEFVTIEDIKKKILVSSNIQQHIDSLKEYAQLGFEKIILHNVGRNQEEFIEVFGEKVLPKL